MVTTKDVTYALLRTGRGHGEHDWLGACVELCNRIMYLAVFIEGNDMIGSSMAT